MKRNLAILLLLPITFFSGALLRAQNTPVYKDPSAPVERRVEALLSQMTLEEKIDMLGGVEGFYIRPSERLGIPKIKMADGPLGVRNYGEATAFPAGIAVAASFNPELMRAVGAAVGKEARSKGVHIMLAPGVNIYRAPMCGRNFEYFGEDPYLAGQMAAAYIKGVQNQGVVATVKHFALNNQEWDRNNVSSDTDERTLQEIYLPAFRAAVQEGGVGAVMTSYNLINGVYASQNNHVVNEILKGQWKFDGLVMSDWGGTHDATGAANGGLDLEMPSGRYMNRTNLLPAIKEGKVKEATIDDKIRRILRVMFRFGWFDRPQEDVSLPLYNPESRLVALQAAREGIVLLKNKGNLLPLDRTRTKSIAVLGPLAHPAVTGGGGSSRVRPFRSVSALDGLVQTAGSGVRVFYQNGLQADPAAHFKTSQFIAEANGPAGLRGEYFANPNLEGSPAFTRVDRTVDFNWAGTGPANDFPKQQFSVRWTGRIRADDTGSYEFAVRGNGFRLMVDNRQVLTSPAPGQRPQGSGPGGGMGLGPGGPGPGFGFGGGQGGGVQTVNLRFRANTDHVVTLEYQNFTGTAGISFGWGRPIRRIEPSAVALAAKADAAVVSVGFDANTEGEGFDRPFTLTAEEEQLINEVAKANPRTIVVVTAGGNVAMTNWLDNVAGLIHAWFPGQEGGTAIAEVLFGDVNPSGKLPASFEKKWEDNATYSSYYDPDNDKRVAYTEGIFLGYRHFDKTGLQPMFPFGFGLSYTTFDYKNLRLSADKIRKGEKLKVSFDLTNTGSREGAEATQLYIRDVQSSEPRPVKELKGLAKVSLKPGETKRIEIEIDESALAFFSAAKNSWVVEPGAFEVLIGSSSKDIKLTKPLEVGL
jgi:beta-glucosidase